MNLDENDLSEYDWQMAIRGDPTTNDAAWQYGMQSIDDYFAPEAPFWNEDIVFNGESTVRDDHVMDYGVEAQDQGGGGGGSAGSTNGNMFSGTQQRDVPNDAMSVYTNVQQPSSVAPHGRTSPMVVIDPSELAAAIRDTANSAYTINDIINGGARSGPSDAYQHEHETIFPLNAVIPAGFEGGQEATSSDEEARRLAHAVPADFNGADASGPGDDFDKEHEEFIRFAARVQPKVFKPDRLAAVMRRSSARSPASATDITPVGGTTSNTRPSSNEELNPTQNAGNPTSRMLKSPTNLPSVATPAMSLSDTINPHAYSRQTPVPLTQEYAHQQDLAWQFPEPTHVGFFQQATSQVPVSDSQTQPYHVPSAFQQTLSRDSDGAYRIIEPVAQPVLQSSHSPSLLQMPNATHSSQPVAHSALHNPFPHPSHINPSSLQAVQHLQSFHRHSFPQSSQNTNLSLPLDQPMLQSFPEHQFAQSLSASNSGMSVGQPTMNTSRHRTLPQSFQTATTSILDASQPVLQRFHYPSVPRTSQVTPAALGNDSFHHHRVPGSSQQPTPPTPQAPPAPLADLEASEPAPQKKKKRSRGKSEQAEEASTPVRKRTKRGAAGRLDVPQLTTEEVQALEGRRTRSQKKKAEGK